MERVHEVDGVCPACQRKTFRVQLFRYTIPHEGPSILFVGRCSHCGFRVVDVIPIELGERKELRYVVGPETLGKVVFLPGDTIIEVPELGIELRLTRAFRGRITTVEGILRMIEEDAPPYVRERIEKAISGSSRVRLIMRSETGLLKEISL